MTKGKNNRRITKNSSVKAGLSPGSLVHIGNKINDDIRINVIKYNEDEYKEEVTFDIDTSFINHYSGVKWIKVNGISDTRIIEKLGNILNINSFVLEDILDTNTRSKFDEYEEYIYIVVKLLIFDEENNKLRGEQISIILGNDYVLSFSEKESEIFEPVFKRIKSPKSNMRSRGVDYLAYVIIDCIVDNYFEVLENMEDSMDILEEELMNKPTQETLKGIYELKRELILLRKSIWPLREVLSSMQNGNSAFIEKSTEMYLRDVYDHIIQVIDTTQLFVDIISGMLDTYLSSVNNKMSEVMKILTIFSTIFIPITFLAGVFGMNFEYMPELRLKWAYPLFWLVALGVISSMLLFFKKREWF